MEGTIGSKGLVKKSEFVRIIIEALSSLGFDRTVAELEKESGVDLHDPTTKQFLELVKNGEWDKSIDTLESFELRDEKSVRFLLLEQKLLGFVKNDQVMAALKTLREEMVPLGIKQVRIHKLASKLLKPASGVNQRSKQLGYELQRLFPPAVIIPEKRLEYLLEITLDRQRIDCDFHNTPDSDLYLCSDHYCGKMKTPTVTVQILGEHTDEVWFLKFSHNGKYLASSSKDNSAIIWEMNAEGKFSMKHKLVGHGKPVVAVLWSPDDRQVITCGEKEVIMRWDVDSGGLVRTYGRNGVGSVSCGWFHDGSGIIGAMEDGRIYLWSLDGAEIEHEQEQRAQTLSDVAMTTDGKWLVSVGRELDEISLFDRETRVEEVLRADDAITSFSLSTDSSHLLIDLMRGEMEVWCNIGDPEYKYINYYKGHKRSRFITRSCFGGYKESFIASGSEDSLVYIWHGQYTVEPLRTLVGHSGAVNCVSWHPTDMHMLASASDDGTIRIWGLHKFSDDDDLTAYL